MIYEDSVPYNLFAYKNPYLNNNSYHTILKHYGISDSGPAFSGLMTAKLANKYEGSINEIDNLFKQLYNAKYPMRFYGYDYPIEDMLGKEYFTSYENTR